MAQPPTTRGDRRARLEERKASAQIQRTRLGIACGVIAIITAPLVVVLTMASLKATEASYGVFAHGGGGPSILLLTFIIGGALVAGGAGLLLRQSWGWWLAVGAAAAGPLDLFRLYRGLFGALNPDHPDFDATFQKLTFFAGIPVVFYVALLVLLFLRPVRSTYRIGL